nr:hypothetical protein [Megavirus caiporensis]
MSINSCISELSNLLDKFELETIQNNVLGSSSDKEFTNLLDFLLENDNMRSKYLTDSKSIIGENNDDMESKYMANYSKKQLKKNYIKQDLCLKDSYKYLTDIEKDILVSMKSDNKYGLNNIFGSTNNFTPDYFLSSGFDSDFSWTDILDGPITNLILNEELIEDNESINDDNFYSSMNEVD